MDHGKQRCRVPGDHALRNLTRLMRTGMEPVETAARRSRETTAEREGKTMSSYFEGRGIGGTTWHTVHFYDGQRVREVSVNVYAGNVIGLENSIPGLIETGMNYKTAKRRIAAYEKASMRRY